MFAKTIEYKDIFKFGKRKITIYNESLLYSASQ